MVFSNLFSASEKEGIKKPIEDAEKHTYKFLSTQTQWVKGDKVDHELQGEFSLNLIELNRSLFQCRLTFEQIDRKKTDRFLPEYYILWDYIQQVDFFMNSHGEVLDDIQVHNLNDSYQEKLEHVRQLDFYNDNPKEQKRIITLLKSIRKNKEEQKQLLGQNPVIKTLGKALFYLEKKEQLDHRLLINYHNYYDQLKHYFGENYHLPLKKALVIDASIGDKVVCSCSAEYNQAVLTRTEFIRHIRGLAGTMEVGEDLLVLYRDNYIFNKEEIKNSKHFIEAESYLETSVANAWYLEDHTFIKRIS